MFDLPYAWTSNLYVARVLQLDHDTSHVCDVTKIHQFEIVKELELINDLSFFVIRYDIVK